jgi:hypothetical protein
MVIAVLMTIGTFTGILALTILRGWVLSILWAWFIVPTFNVAQLSVALAIGLVMTANLIVKAPDVKEQEGTPMEKLTMGFVFSFSLSFIALGSGWIVKQFV